MPRNDLWRKVKTEQENIYNLQYEDDDKILLRSQKSVLIL